LSAPLTGRRQSEDPRLVVKKPTDLLRTSLNVPDKARPRYGRRIFHNLWGDLRQITYPHIDWSTTETLLHDLRQRQRLRPGLSARSGRAQW